MIKKERDLVLVLIKKSNSGVSTDNDPWLSKRDLNNQLLDMMSKENQFQKRIVFVFQDITKFDHYLLVETQRIYEKYCSEQGLHFSRIMVIV